MNQYFTHYLEWEDYRHGMYNTDTENPQQAVLNAKLLLGNEKEFQKAASEVLMNWDISTKVNLTNNSCNKRAWLGAASCSYKYKVPEIFTRIAWNELTEEQKIRANKVAQILIDNWIKKFKEKQYAQTQLRIECF
jgi:hypothetical protein